ncbi:MAG: hypothetical protein GWP91_10580, partial [Rhodobacterales bacterium]|nr:hypothetical protein [Rhodobacterales bacterium]
MPWSNPSFRASRIPPTTKPSPPHPRVGTSPATAPSPSGVALAQARGHTWWSPRQTCLPPGYNPPAARFEPAAPTPHQRYTPTLFDICNKRVALITGKGGVGRTTITAALGRAAAKRGLRVLLTEIGEPDGDYTPLARLFGHETLPGDPIGIGPNLWGCTLWPRRGHELFFKRVIPVGPIARAAANNESLRKLLDSAPS